jgi:hypothetical protein
VSTCMHPRENYTNSSASVRNHCPECRSRICLHCSNAAPESWMSGRCHGCYRTTEADNRARQARRGEERRLHNLAEAWEEGAQAYATRHERDESLPLTNPYRTRLEAMES